MSPDIAVPFFVFGMPVAIVFISRYFSFREKQLAAAAGQRQLPAASSSDGRSDGSSATSKQRELEARIENLESILIALDSELEGRIASRKAHGQSLPASDPSKRHALPSSSDS